jgi:hypothetical protein
MLSAWIAEKGLHCSLNIGMWEASGRPEAAAWGILFADAVRHVAAALEKQQGHAAPDSLQAILRALHDELGEPTSAVQGNFQHGHS